MCRCAYFAHASITQEISQYQFKKEVYQHVDFNTLVWQ
jgi:hypothetical protein